MYFYSKKCSENDLAPDSGQYSGIYPDDPVAGGSPSGEYRYWQLLT